MSVCPALRINSYYLPVGPPPICIIYYIYVCYLTNVNLAARNIPATGFVLSVHKHLSIRTLNVSWGLILFNTVEFYVL